jgi:hypothetical protein
MPPAVSGQGGHNATFRVACVLVIGFGLSVSEALPILRDYNLGCRPPWSEAELLHKLQDASNLPGRRGHLLDDRGRDRYERDPDLQRLEGVRLNFRVGRPVPPLATAAEGAATAPGEAPSRRPDPNAAFYASLFTAAVVPLAPEPPPEAHAEAPAQSPRPLCPRCHGVLMENPGRGLGGHFAFACRRLNCPVCALEAKDRWKATVRHWLSDYAHNDRSTPFYTLTCRKSEWPLVRGQIRRRQGKYFRIELVQEDRYFVCATVAVGDGFARRLADGPCQQVGLDEAIARLEAAIGYLPLVDHKPFTSSRCWPVLSDRKRPPRGWQRLSKCEQTLGSSYGVLNQRGVEPQVVDSTDRWFRWKALVFPLRAAGVSPDHLFDELRVGELLPEDFRATCRGRQGDDGDQDFGNACDDAHPDEDAVSVFQTDLSGL